MLRLHSIPIPASHRVKVQTAALPVAAAPSPLAFDGLVRQTGEALHEELRVSARDRAHSDAVRRACGALEKAGEELVAAREVAESALASDAVNLAVEIARQLLRIEISEQNYGLEEIVRSTLAASDIKRGRCVVHLNPGAPDVERGEDGPGEGASLLEQLAGHYHPHHAEALL